MKRWFATPLAALLIAPAIAQAPQGFLEWKSADLKAYAAKLAPKVNEQKVATEMFADFKTHSMQIAYRSASGEAEFHERSADLFVIESGSPVLVIGGAVKSPRTTAPGEIRGPSIDGGQTRQLAPGDIVHIPARTAHQMTLPKGGSVLYYVLKVNNL